MGLFYHITNILPFGLFYSNSEYIRHHTPTACCYAIRTYKSLSKKNQTQLRNLRSSTILAANCEFGSKTRYTCTLLVLMNDNDTWKCVEAFKKI